MNANPSHLARNSDPESSHAAAEQVAKSDAIANQRAIIERAVKRYPGKTSRELAEWHIPELDRYQVARRLPEIGSIYQCRKEGEGARVCRISRRLACTWWPKLEQGRIE